MPKLVILLALALLLAAHGCCLAARPRIAIPPDFPVLAVPGQDHAMAEMRELFWVHYERGGPLATLWDEWESGPTLWPAVTTDNRMNTIRDRWRAALLARGMDPEGYVFVHQHGSIAHQQGWPFPFWTPGHGWGWHFSMQDVPQGWNATKKQDQAGWGVEGLRDLGVDDAAWRLEATSADAAVTTPEIEIHPYEAPFVQVRWTLEGAGNAQPYLQWATREHPEFSRERMMYFSPVVASPFAYTMVPVYRHPEWKGAITRLRIGFGNPAPGAKIALQAVFTTYDTRHDINNQSFVSGSAIYFRWTGDVNFLRDNIQRMRLAMRYLMTELGGLKEKCIVCPWVGHEGRSAEPGVPRSQKARREVGQRRVARLHLACELLQFGRQLDDELLNRVGDGERGLGGRQFARPRLPNACRRVEGHVLRRRVLFAVRLPQLAAEDEQSLGRLVPDHCGAETVAELVLVQQHPRVGWQLR